jgi:DNA-binding FadR family transcriptional regulator
MTRRETQASRIAGNWDVMDAAQEDLPESSSTTFESLVLRVANRIREDVLRAEENDFLGSQDELMRRYGVSRPTLLQAIAPIIQEKLLVPKRGPGGGYFVRRPETVTFPKLAALYLKGQTTRIDEVVRSISPLVVELAKLAARSTDERLRSRLAQYIREDDVETLSDMRKLQRSEYEIIEIIAEMSDNSMMQFIFSVYVEFMKLLPFRHEAFLDHPNLVREFVAKRRLMIEALLENDSEMAALTAERRSSVAIEWMLRDLSLAEAGM